MLVYHSVDTNSNDEPAKAVHVKMHQTQTAAPYRRLVPRKQDARFLLFKTSKHHTCCRP